MAFFSVSEWLNRTKVYNKNILHEAIASRPQNRGLVTVSNHTSCIDDPLLWGEHWHGTKLIIDNKIKLMLCACGILWSDFLKYW